MHAVSCAAALSFAAAALVPVSVVAEPDQPMPGKVAIVKPDKLVKFVSKPSSGVFDLPDPENDPTVVGASLRFADTDPPGAGDVTFALPASGWKGLGNPPGSKGYKYKGAGSPADPCKVVLIKERVVKAACKGTGVNLSPPIGGDLAVELTMPTKKYCTKFGGTNKKNSIDVFKAIQAQELGCLVATATPTGTSTLTHTAGPSPTPTQTPTQTPTPTPTPTGCLLAAGRYTLTQSTPGAIQIDGLLPTSLPDPSDLPSKIELDLAAATYPDCVHDVVVRFPGGFETLEVCISDGDSCVYTVTIEQTGCGAGKVDSTGGSDFTLMEEGDTSDALGACSLPHVPCVPGVNGSGRVDVTGGDGADDTCASGGQVNVTASVPVLFTVRDEFDVILATYATVLDLTTDMATSTWTDLDADSCYFFGPGPTPVLSDVGTCLDAYVSQTVTLAFAGATFGADVPFYDHLFAGHIPYVVTGPDTGGAICASPPAISFPGTVTRCFP